MTPIERILALWQIGLMPAESVIAWADGELVKSRTPLQDLISLAVDGPKRCLYRSAEEFCSHPRPLTFVEEFSLRATILASTPGGSSRNFAVWASRKALGQDHQEPMVGFGYQLDHLIDDCGDLPGAIHYVDEHLAELLPRCREIASSFLEQLPEPVINPDTA